LFPILLQQAITHTSTYIPFFCLDW
jgi:hypothetical protein